MTAVINMFQLATSYLTMASFNSESKNISTCTMQRKLKGLGLNSRVALRKPLISEANQKKRLQFAREHKDCSNRKRSNGLMSPNSPCSKVMGTSG